LIGYSRGLFILLGHQSKFLLTPTYGSRLDFAVVSNGIVGKTFPASFVFCRIDGQHVQKKLEISGGI
jgi:hypothetical protein